MTIAKNGFRRVQRFDLELDLDEHSILLRARESKTFLHSIWIDLTRGVTCLSTMYPERAIKDILILLPDVSVDRLGELYDYHTGEEY